jgi:hypothetical protein
MSVSERLVSTGSRRVALTTFDPKGHQNSLQNDRRLPLSDTLGNVPNWFDSPPLGLNPHFSARKRTSKSGAMIHEHCSPGPDGFEGLIPGVIVVCQTFECQ